MGDCGDREVVWEADVLLLHKVLKEGLTGGVVGEGEVELFLCEGFDKFLVHFPWLVG
jgi:hypothetical protein